jgi:hypothetical protein
MWTPGTRPPSSYAIRLAEEGSMRADSGVQPASRRMPSAAPAAAREAAEAPHVFVSTTESVDAPPEWRALIERALAKNAAERFQDARSLLAAIRALEPASVDGETSSTGSDKP